MYRNYDGNKSTFGDISIRATAPNPDNVAAFAAIRSGDRALTVMLVNKQLTSTATVALNVANYTRTGSAVRWQLTAAGIARVADAAVGSNITLPAQSVTILAFPGTADVTPTSLSFAAPVMNEARQYSFSGTASDTTGIATVKLHVSGGSPVDVTATGTTSWTAGPIALQNGCNHITVTAYDAAGNPTSLSKTVVHELMAPPPVPPGRSTKRRSVR